MRALLIFPLLAACSSVEVEPLLLPELDEGWNEIPGGEGTSCARGAPYSFFVRKGTVNRVVVDFIGGGACWSEESCSFSGSLFADDMDWMRDLVDNSQYEGIYDTENAENPFSDWYHLIVPYCTGDIHWGDNEVTYGEGEEAFTIQHRGAVNTRDALGWMQESFSGPENIFVTGCSAGAYGSVLWAPALAQAYPEARVAQIGDSGAGVITDAFFRDSFPIWNSSGAFPSWIPALDPAKVSFDDKELPYLYESIGAYYPNMRLSQFNTAWDSTQVFYFQAMGGGSEQAWHDTMVAYGDQLEANLPNFTQFLAPGSAHCTTPYDNLYEFEVDGQRLVDWMSALNTADTLPDSLVCTDC